MTEAVLFYSITAFAILWTGVAKSGFAGGLGVLSVPIMSLVMPPTQAAGILLPLLCVMDLFAVWHYRCEWHKENLKIMLPAAIVGIAVGAGLFRYLTEAHIRILVGSIAVIFVANYFLRTQNGEAKGVSRIRGSFWSMLSGFTSFGAHAGGPPLGVYLLPQRLKKTTYLGTTVFFFAVVNYVKLIPYGYLGQLHFGNLKTSLILAPLAPVGIQLGVWLQKRINETLFYRFCYMFLLITGLKLLVDGFMK